MPHPQQRCFRNRHAGPECLKHSRGKRGATAGALEKGAESLTSGCGQGGLPVVLISSELLAVTSSPCHGVFLRPVSTPAACTLGGLLPVRAPASTRPSSAEDTVTELGLVASITSDEPDYTPETPFPKSSCSHRGVGLELVLVRDPIQPTAPRLWPSRSLG